MKIANIGSYTTEQIHNRLGQEVADLDHLAGPVQEDLEDMVIEVDRFFNSGGALSPLDVLARAEKRLLKRYVSTGLYGRATVLMHGLLPLISQDFEEVKE